jgi:hypothetical protein
MAQEQTEEGTEGVSPLHSSVARRLGLQPDSPELTIGERYLQEQGYIRPIALSEEGGFSSAQQRGDITLLLRIPIEQWRFLAYAQVSQSLSQPRIFPVLPLCKQRKSFARFLYSYLRLWTMSTSTS